MPEYLPDGRRAYQPSRKEWEMLAERRAYEDWLREFGWDETRVIMAGTEFFRVYVLGGDGHGERYSEWQKRVLHPRWAAEAAKRPKRPAFTEEELLWLIEHLAGTNDEIGGSVLAKATALTTLSEPDAL